MSSHRGIIQLDKHCKFFFNHSVICFSLVRKKLSPDIPSVGCSPRFLLLFSGIYGEKMIWRSCWGLLLGMILSTPKHGCSFSHLISELLGLLFFNGPKRGRMMLRPAFSLLWSRIILSGRLVLRNQSWVP